MTNVLSASNEGGLVKLAGLNADDVKTILYGIPLAALAVGGIHNGMVSLEPKKDIHEPLYDIENRRRKMQAVRTAFQDQFGHLEIPDVDNKKTKVTVGRSIFPWKDKYDAHVFLYDKKGKPISDLESPSYDAKVYKDKDDKYTGYVDMIFTRKDMQGKGVGRTVENKMVDAFRELGASKSKLMPAFDGPLVWAKKDFGYQLSPEDKETFLKAYEKWCKKNGVSFQDLGDRPGDYPKEFLKEGITQYPWRTMHYEKPINKAAKGEMDMLGLAKFANYSREDDLIDKLEVAVHQLKQLKNQVPDEVRQAQLVAVLKNLGVGSLIGAGVGAGIGGMGGRSLGAAGLGGMYGGLVGGGIGGIVGGVKADNILQEREPELYSQIQDAEHKEYQASDALERHHAIQQAYRPEPKPQEVRIVQ